MFGGQLESGAASNLLYILKITEKGLEWINGQSVMKGKFPEPRFDHSMEGFMRQSFVIVGGRDQNQFLNSIYLLDFGQLTWTSVE